MAESGENRLKGQKKNENMKKYRKIWQNRERVERFRMPEDSE